MNNSLFGGRSRQPFDPSRRQRTLSSELASPGDDSRTAGVASERHGDDSNLSRYTLTVGQALERFASRGRKIPHPRSMQRYCATGAVDCFKVQTTRKGQPIYEWLVNEKSLMRFVADYPKAGVASTATNVENKPDDLASPKSSGVATPTTRVENEGDDSRTTDDTVFETRTLAEVLIENAQLTGQLSSKDELIDELKEDRNFLREEVREARTLKGDVKEIANRTLETLETIALGGKLEHLPEAPRKEGDNPSKDESRDGVE